MLKPLTMMVIAGLAMLSCASDDDAASVAETEPQSTPVSEAATEVAVSPTPQPAPTSVEQAAVTQADEPVDAESDNDGLYPTVVAVAANNDGEDSWRFDVTLSSEYDSPARYADAWRVLDASGTELGIRVLGHDHANEQPFTRSHSVDVPAELQTVFVEGRDQLNGWSGELFEVTLER